MTFRRQAPRRNAITAPFIIDRTMTGVIFKGAAPAACTLASGYSGDRHDPADRWLPTDRYGGLATKLVS